MNRLLSTIGSKGISMVLRCPEKASMYQTLLERHSLSTIIREVAARVCFETSMGYCIPANKVRFEVTNRCNLRCTMCPEHSLMRREKGLMDFDLYKRVLDNNRHIREVELWNWGEPLLHPDLCDFIRLARARRIRTAITTNATLLSEEKSRQLLASGLDEVTFSIDNVGQEYEKIRGVPWDRVAANVAGFTKIARELNGSVKTLANVTESQTNKIDREALIATLKGLGIQDVMISSCSLFENLEQLSDRTTRCREWYHDVLILVDGKVVPCCVDYDGTLVYGDVKQEPELKKIFNNKMIKAFRRAMRSPSSMPKTCRNCHEFCGQYSVRRFDSMSIS